MLCLSHNTQRGHSLLQEKGRDEEKVPYLILERDRPKHACIQKTNTKPQKHPQGISSPVSHHISISYNSLEKLSKKLITSELTKRQNKTEQTVFSRATYE